MTSDNRNSTSSTFNSICAPPQPKTQTVLRQRLKALYAKIKNRHGSHELLITVIAPARPTRYAAIPPRYARLFRRRSAASAAAGTRGRRRRLQPAFLEPIAQKQPDMPKLALLEAPREIIALARSSDGERIDSGNPNSSQQRVRLQ